MGVGNAVLLSLKMSTQMISTTPMLAVSYLIAKPPVAAIIRTAKIMCQIASFSQGQLPQLRWMPDSCAYRLLYEGKSLPDWHRWSVATRPAQ